MDQNAPNHPDTAVERELDRISQALQQEPVFLACSVEDRARLLGKAVVQRLQPGEVLHQQGAETKACYLILSGCFHMTGEHGKVVRICSGLLGQEAVLTMQTYATTVIASKATEVVVLAKSAFQEMIWNNRALRDLVIASFSDRFGQRAGSDEDLDIPEQGQSGPLLLEAVARLKKEQAKKNGKPVRNLVGWTMTLVMPLAVTYGLGNMNNAPGLQASYIIGITTASVMMWVFRMVPDFVPALFAVTAILLFGLVPPGVALGGFASDSIFLALGIFGLSIVLTGSGFSYRVLLWLLRIGPAHKAWYNVSLFLTGTILTPLVPSCNGRVIILTPFLNDLLNSFNASSARAEGPRLGASVLYGVSLLSSVFLSSKSINFVVFGFLPSQEQYQFNWFVWLYTASVCGVGMLLLYFLGSIVLFRNTSQPHISHEIVRQQLQMLGSMKSSEWAGLLGLGLLLLSFTTVSLNRIGVSWVALSILFALLMLGFLGKKEIQNQVDWPFLLFLAGLIGMINSLRYLHVDIWLTQQMSWLANLMRDDIHLFIAMLAITIFVVRIALPINASVIVFSTLLIPTAVHIGVNPWMVGFLVLLFCESFIWPYQSSYYVQFTNLSSDVVMAGSRPMLMFNLYISIAKVVAVYASIPFWQHLGIL
ncbi:MAG: anion permease [Magnetococcales bacterium]|nr:anion permease [Magnetococcales bacterium]